MKKQLLQSRLMELLKYDRETGEFTWLCPRRGTAKVGARAGSPGAAGRRSISVDGVVYREHRLAWFYVYGIWPVGVIDHIDGNPSNNSIYNLRDVTCAENQQNRRHSRSDSTSGRIGVSWHPTDKLWRARITVDGRPIFIGNFATKDEASSAYIEAKRKLHPCGEL